MCMFPLSDLGRGPRQSMASMSNGPCTGIGTNGALLLVEGFLLEQSVQDFTSDSF